MLLRQSASTTDDWHQLRKSKLAAADEHARRNAITRFYSGRELQLMLHSRARAQHSPVMYTDIPDTITVKGNNAALSVFKDGPCSDTRQVDTLEGTVLVSCIKQADLYAVLALAEQGGLGAELEGSWCLCCRCYRVCC
jgi:hypothetical protein